MSGSLLTPALDVETPPTALPVLRIPIQGGHVFRFDGGQRSDMIAATIPI